MSLKDECNTAFEDIDLMLLNLEHKFNDLGFDWSCVIMPYLDSIIAILNRAITFCSIHSKDK